MKRGASMARHPFACSRAPRLARGLGCIVAAAAAADAARNGAERPASRLNRAAASTAHVVRLLTVRRTRVDRRRRLARRAARSRAPRSGCRPPGRPSPGAWRRWRSRCAASARRWAASSRSGWTCGSPSNTSSPAAAMRRSRSAAASAASSTIAAARDVGQRRGRLHQRQLGRADRVVRRGRVRHDEHQVIGLAQQRRPCRRSARRAALRSPRRAASGCDRSPSCRSRARRAARSPGRCGPCRGRRASRRARRCR